MIISFLIALCVTFLSAPILRQLAVKLDIVDHPEVRKMQKEPVPLLGGVAVYLGILAGAWPAISADKMILSLFLGGSLIFVVSLIDDAKKLSAIIRFFVQLLAATLLISSGAQISFFGPGPVFDVLEIILTLIWILGITNAFNYLDGIDTLCSGLSLIASLFFVGVLYITGQYVLLFFPLAVMGACLGFIPHNLKRKKMFLGDSGRMLLGFFMAGISLIGSWASNDIVKISIPFLILGVPIFDMTFTTIMRAREKKIHNVVEWLEYAGRDHFHHYLIDLGLRPGGAAMFIFAVNVSMGLTAVLITKSRSPLYGITAIFISAITFGLIGVLMVLGRRLHKQEQVKERMGI
jgi:UDP-GlcNAc:undecaprenyl-phosphate GlcNAc-1-phosphate transferase